MNHLNNRNNNDESSNKTPITRVFNLNGLRKNSHYKGIYNSHDEDFSLSTPGTTTTPVRSFDFEFFEKSVYDVRKELSLNFEEKKKFKSENENVLLTTPTNENKTKIETREEDAIIEPPNEIIAQHVSEIDFYERNVSEKVNPVYKSDDDDDDDDFYVYQDPVQVHALQNLFENLNFDAEKKNISVIEVGSSSKFENIYATINENDLYLTPIELNKIVELSVKETYVSAPFYRHLLLYLIFFSDKRVENGYA